MKARATKRNMSGAPDPCQHGCLVYFDKAAGLNRDVLERSSQEQKPRGAQWRQCWDCKVWCRLGPVREVGAKERDYETSAPSSLTEDLETYLVNYDIQGLDVRYLGLDVAVPDDDDPVARAVSRGPRSLHRRID